MPTCLSVAFCPFRLGGRQPACVSKAKKHSKIHRRQVRSSFAGAEMGPDKKRPAENTCRIVKGLDAVWAHFCPPKPCLPLSIDGAFHNKKVHVPFIRHYCLRKGNALDRPPHTGRIPGTAGQIPAIAWSAGPRTARHRDISSRTGRRIRSPPWCAAAVCRPLPLRGGRADHGCPVPWHRIPH